MAAFRAAAAAVLPVVLLQGCGGGTTTTTPVPTTTTLAPSNPVVMPTIEIVTDAGKAAIDAAGEITHVAGTYQLTEGPIYAAAEKTWVFSDVVANTMYKVVAGEVSEFRKPSERGNGNAIDPDGNLVTAEQKGRTVSRYNWTSSTWTVLVDEYEGKKLNGPNDVIVSKAGIIYFTDPNYGSLADYGHGLPQEQEFCNVFMYDPSTKNLTSVLETYVRPNGLALSVDESKMYIVDSGAGYTVYNASLPHMIGVFDVASDGTLSNEQTFYTLPDNRGVPDGIKVDTLGNVWSTSADAVEVLNPSGAIIAKINTNTTAVNLAFGGDDGMTLMLAAATDMFLIKTKVKGATDTTASGSIFQF